MAPRCAGDAGERPPVRALLPHADDDVDLVGAYEVRPPLGAREPFVRGNMISTLDGAISVQGRSGMLGGPADRRVFQTLRSWADVIVVGAGTARIERYGPARLDEDLRQRRLARGQPPVPAIALVTRTAQLDWSSPFFTEAEARPLVLTTAAGERHARDEAAGVAELVVAGEGDVEIERAFDSLGRSGCRSVLVEGGPGLNADVVKAGLLDELCLTLSPRLVAGNGPRVVAGEELAHPLDLDIVHLLEEDGFLFCRLAVASS
jgi:riboflavin biosynthesis pyrimidine reductase